MEAPSHLNQPIPVKAGPSCAAHRQIHRPNAAVVKSPPAAGDRDRRVIEANAQQRGVSFKEREQFMFQFTSFKEYVTPQQLADMVVITASPRARTISGQALSVCGDTNMLG
jgi:hypothetical protein